MIESIGTAGLIKKLDILLMSLLNELNPEDWKLQTVARKWKVKDVVAHLLDGNIRSLSMLKHTYFGTQPRPDEPLVDFLNRLNAEWVEAMKRVSPQMLVLMHQQSGPLYCEYIASLSPQENAVFAVNWAGEKESKNWMHIAREYTEKWLHQQQIREAIDDETLLSPEYFQPFINTFMLGMPSTLSPIVREEGTSLKITIQHHSPMIWYLVNRDNHWAFTPASGEPATAQVEIPAEVAWKLFSKSLRPEDVATEIQVRGDEELGQAALRMVSVMA